MTPRKNCSVIPGQLKYWRLGQHDGAKAAAEDIAKIQTTPWPAETRVAG
jgi:hypothetical protein